MDRKVKLHGITLIEILVVLSIMAILLSIAVPQYTKWKKKYDYEYDIKQLYSIISDARMKSYLEKRVCGVFFGTSPFTNVEIKCDTDNEGDITDAGSETIATINLNKSFESSSSYVKFTDGIAKNLINLRPHNTITTFKQNCISISVTRIRIGNWDGTNCNY
ncbi:hypothetical protein JCM12298_15970 [Desulfothermus naphthae]